MKLVIFWKENDQKPNLQHSHRNEASSSLTSKSLNEQSTTFPDDLVGVFQWMSKVNESLSGHFWVTFWVTFGSLLRASILETRESLMIPFFKSSLIRFLASLTFSPSGKLPLYWRQASLLEWILPLSKEKKYFFSWPVMGDGRNKINARKHSLITIIIFRQEENVCGWIWFKSFSRLTFSVQVSNFEQISNFE